MSWADISDGQFRVMALDNARLPSELAALAPRELILSESLYQDPDFLERINMPASSLTPLASPKFDRRNGETRLKETFGVGSLEGLGDFSNIELSALGALLDYVCLLYTSPSPRDQRGSRMPSSA